MSRLRQEEGPPGRHKEGCWKLTLLLETAPWSFLLTWDPATFVRVVLHGPLLRAHPPPGICAPLPFAIWFQPCPGASASARWGRSLVFKGGSFFPRAALGQAGEKSFPCLCSAVVAREERDIAIRHLPAPLWLLGQKMELDLCPRQGRQVPLGITAPVPCQQSPRQ